MQTWSPGQPRRDGESCRLRCPMAREVSPCPCWSHCSSWPEFLKLFVCYRGKKNLLQIQCLFISQAASLPAEAGPFWMGPTVGIGSWDIQHPSRCPWLELPSPHGGPSLPTPHWYELLTILSWSWSPSLLLQPPPLPEWRHWRGGRHCPQHWGYSLFSGRMTPGKRGEMVEGMEIPVLVLGAGVALGIPCCRALPASPCWWSVQWHCCLSCRGNAHLRQRGAQTCWQRALQAHTWVKIGRASQLLVFCLICYPKAFLQNYHGHKPAKVQNSLPVPYYDNENTADIFN